jgi:hypothetical protein
MTRHGMAWYGKCSNQEEEGEKEEEERKDFFHQQIVLKCKEEISEMLRL